jgi:opacity protein-like surface antigen
MGSQYLFWLNQCAYQQGIKMKKIILAVVLLTVLANSAFSAPEDKYVYSSFAGGSVASMTPTATESIAEGSSYGVFIGYQFGQRGALEGGYTSLLRNSSKTFSAIGAIGDEALAGTEVAAIFNIPINRGISPFLRIGSARMTETLDLGVINGIIKTPLSGLTYGLGLQLNQERFGLRLGYDAYNLKDNIGNVVTPRNAYIALILKY